MSTWYLIPPVPAVVSSFWPQPCDPVNSSDPLLNSDKDSGGAMTVLEEKPFAQQLSNVYFTILALFSFKLFVKISLAILSHFYIVKGNRKEAARIKAEFYAATQGQGTVLITHWSVKPSVHTCYGISTRTRTLYGCHLVCNTKGLLSILGHNNWSFWKV